MYYIVFNILEYDTQPDQTLFRSNDMKSNRELGRLEEFVLLAIQRQRGTAYGVSIRADIKERAGKEYAIGAIYTTLDRLEQKGYVKSRDGEATAERGGRKKKYYTIDAPGVLVLQSVYENSAQMWDGIELGRA